MLCRDWLRKLDGVVQLYPQIVAEGFFVVLQVVLDLLGSALPLYPRSINRIVATKLSGPGFYARVPRKLSWIYRTIQKVPQLYVTPRCSYADRPTVCGVSQHCRQGNFAPPPFSGPVTVGARNYRTLKSTIGMLQRRGCAGQSLLVSMSAGSCSLDECLQLHMLCITSFPGMCCI